MKPLVIYHARCSDGFCAAWVAKRALGDADFLPISYGDPVPDVKGRRVYVLDFSWRRGIVEQLMSEAIQFTLLDHHKSAEAELYGIIGNINDTIAFDMEKSGGRMAWDYFFPGKPAPWLVLYTEDRDLWRWKLPHSHAVSAFIRSYPFDFDRWNQWNQESTMYALSSYMVQEGEAILRAEQTIIDAAVARAKMGSVAGYNVPIVNTSVLMSEICGKIAEGHSFGATYYDDFDLRHWSFRSDKDGIDVSEVAKKMGGGGHFHAAGFEEKIRCA